MEENKESMEENYWLVHFPIMFFVSVMGVGGLSLVVNKSIDIFLQIIYNNCIFII